MSNETDQEVDHEPTPYKGKAQQEVEGVTDEEILAGPQAEQEEDQEPEGKSVFGNKPDHNWKKRYDDLKRHHDNTIKKHKAALEEASPQIDLPTTPEELSRFRDEYPEVFDVIQTVSTTTADDRIQDLQERLDHLTVREEELVAESAEQELLTKHPDFEELKQDENFLSWLDAQPTNISDGIYENNTNAAWAARVIDLYKADSGSTKQKKKRSKKADAADVVTTTTRGSDPSETEGRMWTMEEIGKLSPSEYAHFEKEIDKANREGRITA